METIIGYCESKSVVSLLIFIIVKEQRINGNQYIAKQLYLNHILISFERNCKNRKKKFFFWSLPLSTTMGLNFKPNISREGGLIIAFRSPSGES